jgi:3-hydroxyisobutyrate dehydrogenase
LITVGFTGLGRKGAPMAINVARAGFPLVLRNRSADKAEALARSVAASVAASPRCLAESSEVVITILADNQSPVRVHLDADGVLAADRGADVVMAMGTHSPRQIDELAAAAGFGRRDMASMLTYQRSRR